MIWIASARLSQGCAKTKSISKGSRYRTNPKRRIAPWLYGLSLSTTGLKEQKILALYMIQGQKTDPFAQIDKHFESAISTATASGDAQHEVVLRWLHAAGRIMVTNSLWWAARSINSRTSEFVHSLTHREHRAMFELLPPQRAALLEKGLLDQAKTAIVVDLPTSGGKTLLAQFRILQALNQFDADKGWVAYIVPTRALAAQITRRLRQDFEPVNIRVEQLTSAVEVDTFEDQLLSDHEQPFHILVATPEKTLACHPKPHS